MTILKEFYNNATRLIRVGARAQFIGASKENDIVALGKGIADVSAKLCQHAQGIEVQAIKYGDIRVNGAKIHECICAPGNRITIGDMVYIVEDMVEHSAQTIVQPVFDEFVRFSEAVGNERDLTTLLQKIITILLSALHAEEAFILTLDDRKVPRVFVSSNPAETTDRFSDTIVQEVLRNKSPLCIGNVLADNRFGAAQSIMDLNLSTVLCCPMMVAQQVLGVMYVGSKNPTVSFGDRDMAMMRLYALMAGMLIDHVGFIAQQNDIISQLSSHTADAGFIAGSHAMKKVLVDIDSVAGADITVLLTGETGTGKDVIAQRIHAKSSRASFPFIPVNCSSLKGELLESELFGHKKGSFTGATRDHDGLFVAASNGTLFLDEISEIELSLQAKLLRTLETGKVRAVGATSENPINVRIICATNRDLKSLAAEGLFRQDLYFRIDQFRIQLPPLRERGADIHLLAYFYLEKFRTLYPAKKITDFHPDSLKAMLFYEWPGNIRELSSAVHKAVLSSQSKFVELDLENGSQLQGVATLESATREFQSQLIMRTLSACSQNREEAAKTLGMSRATFFRYLAAMNEPTK